VAAISRAIVGSAMVTSDVEKMPITEKARIDSIAIRRCGRGSPSSPGVMARPPAPP
jgi:hypothetical protein